MSVKNLTDALPESAMRVKRVIRVKKEESAYVYAILESHGGAMSYSTLESPPGVPYRDLELSIPIGMADEADAVLKQLGDLIYEL